MLGTRNYNALLERFVHSAETTLGESGLTEAKTDFEAVINSKRRSSCVNNFKELVTLLQRRGHIGEHRSVEPLRRISKKLGDPDLDRLMDSYDECLRNYRRQFFNVYSGLNSAHLAPPQREEFSSECSLSSRSPLFVPAGASSYDVSLLPEDVAELICTDIGRQWMELARKLDIREAEIDAINSKYPSDLRAKAREVVRLFTSRADPQKLQKKLLDALVQARRRDLKEVVEDILNRRRGR